MSAKRDKDMDSKLRIIVSGGGTGGHIFPAISIANAIRELRPEAEILFVGAEGRMEMQRVPDAGYPIIGLPVAGFDRSRPWRNVAVLIKLMKSQRKARRVIRDFRPQLAIGVGGYASGPTLREAARMGIPTLIQEQNSYAGVTNKLLAKRARRICVAYEGMERFFPAEKLVMTGNPVRQSLLNCKASQAQALATFGLEHGKKTLLIIGGSLGARTINQTLVAALPTIRERQDVQFIWQTGRIYIEEVRRTLAEFTRQAVDGPVASALPNLYVSDFISDMAMAYAAADLVISRAGAGSISELCLLGKPVILVPSPNVAEDHQTKNAMALVSRNAALCVRDAEAREQLIPIALNTLSKPEELVSLSRNIALLGLPDSANAIAREALSLIPGQGPA